MDLLGTYPRRLIVFVGLSLLILVLLRRPIAFLNGWRGDQESMAGNAAWALSEYRRSVYLDPSNVEAGLSLAYTLGKRGDAAGSLAIYRLVLDYEPGNAEAAVAAAQALDDAGDLREAEDVLTRAIEANPDGYQSWQRLATVRRDRGETDAAIETWREIAGRFPWLKEQAEQNLAGLEKSR